jgi:hypothetical protein
MCERRQAVGEDGLGRIAVRSWMEAVVEEEGKWWRCCDVECLIGLLGRGGGGEGGREREGGREGGRERWMWTCRQGRGAA